MRRGDYDTGISSALSSLQDVLGAPAQQMPQQTQQMPTSLCPQMPQPQMPQPQMPQPQMPQPQMPQNGLSSAALTQLLQQRNNQMQPMRQPQAMTNGPLSAMGRGQMPRSFKEGGRVDRGYGSREDGTPKGDGFYGMLQRRDDPRMRSSEVSIGVDMGDGRETSIPSMVPGLSRQQIEYILSHKMPSQDIIDKARNFAVQRRMVDLPYFARPEEERVLSVPRR